MKVWRIKDFLHKTRVKSVNALPYDQPPVWAREAIWYQIFVERFRQGNHKVNPSLATCQHSLIDPYPDHWSPTPWGHNWYKQEDWAIGTGLDFYRTIQMRRYGGDLDGVLEKVPYLKDLGVTAVYFNPVNDAPSLHKYDVRYYHHIDVTFGDDIEGDIQKIESENPADPSTWIWTTADDKFVRLVRKLHENGIRVILDFSWNHTGNHFWAFRDIQDKLELSPYKDWYHTTFQNDSLTGVPRMAYDGWGGIGTLPVLKKVETTEKVQGLPFEGNLHPEVKNHIFHVCRRWMDPHNDGSMRDGIDGMRLDVAEHVPMGFWRDFRQFVRSVNPEFYLVGENWWYEWPDQLMDPQPWLQGDVFDAVMHYQWFKLARGYFAQPEDKLSLNEFKEKVQKEFQKYPEYTQQAMMNVGASHDSPRLLTSFFNKNKYKYLCKPQEDSSYKTQIPDEETYHRVRLYLLHQFTFVGAPHIWNGDEMGMTGADDPDCRKPLVWPDINFDKETASEFSSYFYEYQPQFDAEMYKYYKSLIKLRKSSKAFVYGSYEFVDLDDGKNVLAYYRLFQNEKYLIIFNNNDINHNIFLGDEYQLQMTFTSNNIYLSDSVIYLPPFSGAVMRCSKRLSD